MTVFIARQPILTTNRTTVGYEMLFRSSRENVFDASDRHVASLEMMNDGIFLRGINALVGTGDLYVNFEPRTVLNGFAGLLPPDRTVIEIRADVEFDDDLLPALAELRKLGFRIALDSLRPGDLGSSLLEVADLAKVDFTIADEAEWAAVASICRGRGLGLVAEQIETDDLFRVARRLGYQFFQGYFFAEPHIIESSDVPASKSSQLQLLREINRAEIDFSAIEQALSGDLALSYKLLTLINSAAFGLRHHIESLRQAAVILGEQGVRKWASVVILTQLAADGPPEIAVQSLVRAGFCSAFAPQTNLADRQSELFLMGLFSMLDSILSRPMDEILENLPLAPDIEAALLGESNAPWKVLELVLAHERANWESVRRIIDDFGLQESRVAPVYRQVIAQAYDVLS